MDTDQPGAGSSPWSPPDAGRPSAPPPPSGPQIETDSSDGPPLAPPLRARRRRRRIILAVVVAVIVIAIPIGLAVGGAAFLTLGSEEDGLATDGTSEDTEATEAGPGDGPDEGATDGPEGDTDGSEPEDPIGDRPGVTPSLDAPDPAELSGSDAVYAQLLIDVDRSERVMIGFQDDVAEAFGSAGADDDLIGTLQSIAADGRDDLLAVREDLLGTVDDDGAEVVRERYLRHLDSWADYMDAVAADPQVLAGEGTAGGFTVVINQTADAFRRALDEQLPLDADGALQDFAEGILDRGFRSSGDAQV